MMRFAVTMTLAGDERVVGTSQSVNAWGSHRRTVTAIAKKGTLAKHVRTSSSKLSGSSSHLFVPRDDTAKAAALARQRISVMGARLVSGTIELPGLTSAWLPGDLVTGLEPRGLDFRTTSAAGATGARDRWPEVVQTVLINDPAGQRTQVTLDDLRTARKL
jgi:hypothetical protein